MAVSVGPSGGSSDPMVEVNTTPLIDVMLVLLVMLIVTLPIQMHGIPLDNPINPPPVDTTPVVYDIKVDFDGTYTWNGTPADLATLDLYFAQIVDEPDAEVHIFPDELVQWDYVARVLATAQRRGVTKIGFAGNERFIQ